MSSIGLANSGLSFSNCDVISKIALDFVVYEDIASLLYDKVHSYSLGIRFVISSKSSTSSSMLYSR